MLIPDCLIAVHQLDPVVELVLPAAMADATDWLTTLTNRGRDAGFLGSCWPAVRESRVHAFSRGGWPRDGFPDVKIQDGMNDRVPPRHSC